MVAFQFRMGAGIAGAYNRVHDATIVALPLDGTVPPGYGVMGSFGTAGAYRLAQASDTLANFAGLYARPYPTHGDGSGGTPMVNDPLGTSTAPTKGIANVMKRGFMTVQLNAASPAVVRGQAVGIFIGTASAGNPVGGVTGAAPGATVIALGNNSYFMGPADANGITEIAYNL